MKLQTIAYSSFFMTVAALGLLSFFAACKKNIKEPSTLLVNKMPVNITANAGTTSTTAYQMVWADEFDGTSVNTANWNFETGGGGWGNNEKQYYQAANATVSNGALVITAKKQRVKANNYTSARMTTKSKQEVQYGKIEARIKIPLVQGLWPAFWMLGANHSIVGWPKCGEIDIMEHINTEPTVHGTIHWDINNNYSSYGGNTNTTPADFHVYAVEWDSSTIRWYVDGIQFHEANILNNINSTEEFHRPFFMILNLAVGGNWPGQIIDDSKLPASMYVDYVRVYKAL